MTTPISSQIISNPLSQAQSPHQSLAVQSYTPLAPRTPPPGLRYPSNKKTIYDRNLNRSKGSELSRASFAYLFVEMVSYAQKRVTGIADLEKRLNKQGYPLGLRLLELLLHRSTPTLTSSSALNSRPTRLLTLLTFISQTLWRHLFNRPADAVEKATSNPNEYMITDNDPLVNHFISVPKEMSQLNCAAFVAGIVEGICDASGFGTEGVSAHSVEDAMWPGKTIFLIRFKQEVLEREEILGKGS